MPRIFISYRRDDSKAAAGRLYDHLERAFGQENLFMDVDNIPPGVDFSAFLQNAITEADIILIVIGLKWVPILKQRRKEPNDFVRIELESALLQRKITIPVLVDGARMPSANDLPKGIADIFPKLNAATLGDGANFRRDTDRLITLLQNSDTLPPPPPLPPTDAVSTAAFKLPASRFRWLLGILPIIIIFAIGILITQLGNNNNLSLTQTLVAQNVAEPSLTATSHPFSTLTPTPLPVATDPITTIPTEIPATDTSVSPTTMHTAVPPTLTLTNIPTDTSVPHIATNTLVPPTATYTIVPPTPTNTDAPTAEPISGRLSQPVKVKIASQSPLSGGQSILGNAVRDGVELAINQYEKVLEQAGISIEYVPYDDQATPDVGVANAQNIVSDPDILAVIGHVNSGVAIPSSDVYNSGNLVMISPASQNPTLTDRDLSTVNRVIGRYDLEGTAGALFAASQGYKSVYVLHDTTYGQEIATNFQDMALKMGLSVIGFEGTTEKSNFKSVYTPILSTNPDMVFFGGIYDQVGKFVKQIRAAGYKGIIMGSDGLLSADFATLAGDAVVGTYIVDATIENISKNPAYTSFVDLFTSYYGRAPDLFAAQSYDATMIAMQAILQAALNVDGKPTRSAVAQAVRNTQNYTGITGTYSFDAKGDPKTIIYYIYQVQSIDTVDWVKNLTLVKAVPVSADS